MKPGFRLTGFLAWGLCAANLISGCALMHNETVPHAQIPPEQIRLADDIHLARDGWPAARWWTRYGDTQLNELIERGLAGSPTMAIAQSRIEQSRSQIGMLGADLRVSALAAIDRQRASGNGFLAPYSQNIPALGLTGPWYTEATIGVFADLDIDLWGKKRSTVTAAIGNKNASVAEAAAVEIELSTQIARLYYDIQSTYCLIDLLEQSRRASLFSIQAHEEKKSRGLGNQTAVQLARVQLLEVERRITAARLQITQAREMMRALIGARADELAEIKRVPLPSSAAALPATLSYELLARRPDLQALRWCVQSSLSQIDAAKAAFYPSLDIKAFLGLDTIQISKLFQRASQQINLIPGLYLPIFDGGRLNANLNHAREANNALVEQYNQAVLNAVRDVALSASQLQALADERRLQTQKIEALQFTQRAAEAAHRQGLASLLAAVEASQPVLAEQMILLTVDQQQLAQEIALTKALGGGYRADTPTGSEQN